MQAGRQAGSEVAVSDRSRHQRCYNSLIHIPTHTPPPRPICRRRSRQIYQLGVRTAIPEQQRVVNGGGVTRRGALIKTALCRALLLLRRQ